MKKEQIDALVIDEIHRLKNPNSAQSRRIGIVSKKIPYRYGLTGTPIADNVIDLFGEYRALNPDLLGDNYKRFKQQWCYQTGWANKEVAITDANRDRVLQLLAPHTYQVSKRQAFPNLKLTPPVRLYGELKGTQKKLYQQLERDMVAEYDDFTITAGRTITRALRLQQITGGHCPSDDGDLLTFECGKADVFNDFLKDWPRTKKLVIFARFIHELELIEEICKKNRRTTCIYSPDTPEMEDEFQNEKNPMDFITQIQRGSEALTLTASSTPVFFSRTHSNLLYQQAVARCDRAGQKDPVTPLLLLTRDTVDEDVDQAIEQKQSEAQFCKAFIDRIRKHLTSS